MKLNIIAIGSLTKEYQNLYDSYLKKISFFASINLKKYLKILKFIIYLYQVKKSIVFNFQI